MKEYFNNEESSYVQYFHEKGTGFKYHNLKSNSETFLLDKNFHHIFFILKGEILLSCNEFNNRNFETNECVLIPKSAEFSYKVTEYCEMIIFSFNHFFTLCDKLSFLTLSQTKENINYNFQPVILQYPLIKFFDLLVYYMKNGMDWQQLHDLKGQELFLIFRGYYKREDLANLFYQIIGKTINFKGMVLQNYINVNNVNELAERFNMSRANFDKKFKDEFDMPPYKWLLKQKAKHVKHDLLDPEVTLSDVMNKYNFNSSTHFNRFCKQQFGCNPTDLVKKNRVKND